MNLWQVAIEESTGRVLSTPQPVTIPAATMAHLSLSADGTRMAFSNHGVRSTIERVAFDAKSGTSSDVPVPVTNSTRDWSGPSFSPDAQWIAFSSGLPREDVYVSRVDGSGLRQLTNDQPFDRFAQWAPDGSRILFYSNRGGSQQEWTIRPDGSDLRQVSNYPGTGVVGARWSADGLRIAGESQSEKRSVIFDLQKPLEHRAVDKIAVTPAGETCTGSPSFSPEGTRIACGFCARSTQDCEPNLAIYSLADKTFERFPVAGTAPVWLRDGRRLLFVEHGNLRLLDTVSKHVVKLLSVTPNWLGTFSISRDETQIALTRIAEQGDIYLLTFKSQP
jgi:Tol biopolymer transport system component